MTNIIHIVLILYIIKLRHKEGLWCLNVSNISINIGVWNESAVYFAVVSAGGVQNQASDPRAHLRQLATAVLQFVGADILEPVGQQNGETTEWDFPNTEILVYNLLCLLAFSSRWVLISVAGH